MIQAQPRHAGLMPMRGRGGAWSAQRFKGGSAGRGLRDGTLGPSRHSGGSVTGSGAT